MSNAHNTSTTLAWCADPLCMSLLPAQQLGRAELSRCSDTHLGGANSASASCNLTLRSSLLNLYRYPDSAVTCSRQQQAKKLGDDVNSSLVVRATALRSCCQAARGCEAARTLLQSQLYQCCAQASKQASDSDFLKHNHNWFAQWHSCSRARAAHLAEVAVLSRPVLLLRWRHLLLDGVTNARRHLPQPRVLRRLPARPATDCSRIHFVIDQNFRPRPQHARVCDT